MDLKKKNLVNDSFLFYMMGLFSVLEIVFGLITPLRERVFLNVIV